MAAAVCLIRPRPDFRFEAFRIGLERCGFEVGHRPATGPDPADVLLTWNRSAENGRIARVYELAGCKVVVAENGYFGWSWRGGYWYALARDQHNGAGRWPDVDAQRWDGWGVDLAPWRTTGSEIVILAQRGIGSPHLRSPQGWEIRTRNKLAKHTPRPIRIRRHPGLSGKKRSLEDDLADAWCVVTWASGAALKALLMGVPVFYECPSWIGGPAARPFGHDLEDPFRGDRLPMFRRLAGAMWNVDEIASGEPFRHLLEQ